MRLYGEIIRELAPVRRDNPRALAIFEDILTKCWSVWLAVSLSDVTK